MAVCAAGARFLESLVYGVAVIDAGSLALAAAVAGGFLATYVPARRAATADPLPAIKVN